MMRKAAGLACLTMLALLPPLAAFGQAVYGNIVGSVVDPSGAAVPNARVTITDISRSVSFSTTTH